MKRTFKIVHSLGDDCAGGSCPTIYKTDDNTYVLQGKKMTDQEKIDLNIPVDEDIIELPADFLETFLKK